jgi:hypothetical protein
LGLIDFIRKKIARDSDDEILDAPILIKDATTLEGLHDLACPLQYTSLRDLMSSGTLDIMTTGDMRFNRELGNTRLGNIEIGQRMAFQPMDKWYYQSYLYGGSAWETISNFDTHRATSALSGGDATFAMYAPGSGYKYIAFEGRVNSDNTTNPASTNNLITINEETSGTVLYVAFGLGSLIGNWPPIKILYEGAAADKDIQCVWTGGNDDENVYTLCMAGKFA